MTIICDLFSDQLPVAIMESELQLDGSPTGAMFDSDLQLVRCDGSCDLLVYPTHRGWWDQQLLQYGMLIGMTTLQ